MMTDIAPNCGSVPKSSLREAQRALTRQRLCEAAGRLFYQHGFAPVRMEDVAQAAGVSRSTLYVHYPDKTALSVEIASSYADALTFLVARLPGPVPTRPQIREWLEELSTLFSREHVPATLINELTARGDVPEAINLINERLLAALAAQLPAFEHRLNGATTYLRAKIWAEAAMREIGLACMRAADRFDNERSARLTVATEIFDRFVQAQIEMEA